MKGANVLETAKFVKAEAADFDSYEGGCTLANLERSFQAIDYQEVARMQFASKEGVGHYYDVIWINRACGRAQGLSRKAVR